MKYIITGSIGHISKPVVKQLVEAGHEVTVISSNADRKASIESLGAKALIGNVEEKQFVVDAFKGADAVYLMIPPNFGLTDWPAYLKLVADNYAASVQENGIKKVVLLSSIGAHLKHGAGPVDGLAYLEDKLNEQETLDAVYLRPGYFYYNFLSMVPLIKNAGIMGGNQPADTKLVLVHPADIADVAAQYLLALDFKGKTIRYIVSDEKTWTEVTNKIGETIGKQDLQWVEFTDEQSHQGMTGAGLPATIADGYTQMGASMRTGEMQADFFKQSEVARGKVKLADYLPEFTAVFNAN